MKITIGLCTPNPGWEIVLSQEGFSFEKIDTVTDINAFALIIPDTELIRKQKKQLLKFMNNGGIVIVDKDTSSLLGDVKYITRNIKYVIPDNNSIFHFLGLIDCYTQFQIPADNALVKWDEDCKIYEYPEGRGRIVILPFSVNELILSQTSIRKRFFAQRKELPSEVVSQNNKRKIREIISLIIQKSYRKMNLPVVKKNVFPDRMKNTFIFRVDTDFCSGEDAQNVYDLCKKYDIKATWFVDTRDERLLSDVYRNFADHEISLHCEHHAVYASYKKNFDHFTPALEKLQENGITAKGFAAPFGDWNEALGQVIEDLGFEYSSEFALDYDDVPFYPFFNDHFSLVLQIPIHPISIGRLRRSHFTDKEMIKYYKKVIDYNFSHNLPAIIYHHPHHKRLNVIEEIFSYIKTKNVWNPTLLDFSLWWKKRTENNFSCSFTHDLITVNSSDQDMCYKIITEDGSTATIQPNRENKLDDLNFTKAEPIQFDEKKYMRQYFWRDSLNNYEQRKAKKKQ